MSTTPADHELPSRLLAHEATVEAELVEPARGHRWLSERLGAVDADDWQLTRVLLQEACDPIEIVVPTSPSIARST